jgi:hypothetical protein
MQIEKQWAISSSTETAVDEAASERALERAIAELSTQLGELRKTARELKRSDALQFVPDDQPRRGKSSLDRLVKSIEADLDELVEIRDLVVAFQKREITLAEFLRGPEFEFGGERFDFDDLLTSVLEEAHAPRSRSRNRRGSPRRDGRR